MQFNAPSFVFVDNQRRLAYDEVCPANPRGTVLLLTGLGAKRHGWYKQLEFFGRYYRTIALDHREVSESDPVTENYTISDLADDAAAALKALRVQKTHVLGISLGGFVALQFAARHPELLDKLVLISTSAGGSTHVAPGDEMTAWFMNTERDVEVGELARRNYSRIMAPGYAESHPEEIEVIAEIARHRPFGVPAYMRQFQAALGHDATQQLQHIHAPTLVIHGDADPLVVAANGEYLAQQIKGAKHIVYHNVGHVPIIENAAQFNRDVLAFLEADEQK